MSALRTTDADDALEASFSEVIHLIRSARQSAYQAVNTALIDLYWRVGAYLSRQVEESGWGESVVEQLARRCIPSSRIPSEDVRRV